jgi:hypothetical protein
MHWLKLNSLKKAVIDFMKVYYDDHGKSPTISLICKKVPKVYTSKFYSLFPGKLGEACDIANIPRPTKRILKTEKASMQKKMDKKIKELKVLNISEILYNEINAISYLENKSINEVLEQLVSNHRVLFNDLKMTFDDVNFLRNAFSKYSRQVNIADFSFIIDILKLLGLNRMTKNHILKLIDIVDHSLKNNWDINTLNTFYVTKKEIYANGYNKCITEIPNLIIDALNKYDGEYNISPMDKLSIINNITTELYKKGVTLSF